MQLLSVSNRIFFCSKPDFNIRVSRSQVTSSINVPDFEERGLKMSTSANVLVKNRREKDIIREGLLKVDLSASSYDTAWVAMVPSLRFPKSPCFPECIDWILNNQHHDGSWGLPHRDPSLIKDVLSSTLACILALHRWNVGEEHVNRGLQYIGSNSSSILDKRLQSPVGFIIIFPCMIDYAINMGLDIPISQSDTDIMLNMREMELKRFAADSSEGGNAYHAYVAEGLRELQDWQEIMKYQKKNGSLFNSPSTTAAAIIHTQNENAFNYLHWLLKRFGNSVPTVYPLDIYTRLCIVDDLEKLGISRHFSYEIKSTLDNIYRCWTHDDEEISSDAATCAMAFRILRMNGYDISSDALAEFDEVDHFKSSVQGHLSDMRAVLELYKASQIKFLPNEQILDKIESWSGCYLKEEVSADVVQQLDAISEEVAHALKFPFYANLDRLEHKKHIELSDGGNLRILKTSYVINKKDVLKMAVEDFNLSQSMYRKELECLEKWVKDNKLDRLEFARQKLAYCYLSTAATLFPPEMADARMSWAKNSVLTTVVDDFFDVGGSREELLNIIMLVERWDGIHEKEFCSKQVEIVFSALYSTINELGAKASALQKRSVTPHIIEIWLNLMKSMIKEAEWLMNKSVPSLDDYMENGYVSFALGPIILPALYFVGPKLSEDVIRDPEYHNLYKLVSTCGRLLNDVQGFERELKEGKLNSLALHILHGSITEDEAKKEAERIISSTRRELLRLVSQTEGSVVPKDCKELFWKMSKVLHLFYLRNDGFTSPKEMVAAVNSVIYDPLEVGHLQL
ncbi:ent-kaur-16-ene synthase, chloroplastic isoform X2 [Asparagus officinalis]|uniref:ent-kaur-16-ene synthase, chloroplastic isoform X2 n=1 Tax=Asparagus officinalis TaxID=4686 RepID=UPI00098E13A1|nr:ent-kaur-16-ene synthase, chloroplastic isoform X2 [Asparagus officinalis]